MEEPVKYVVLAVASDTEAQRLIDDMTENPGEPMRTPRWGNGVHTTLVERDSHTATPSPAPAVSR
jgi:hypothetical protein